MCAKTLPFSQDFEAPNLDTFAPCPFENALDTPSKRLLKSFILGHGVKSVLVWGQVTQLLLADKVGKSEPILLMANDRFEDFMPKAIVLFRTI